MAKSKAEMKAYREGILAALTSLEELIDESKQAILEVIDDDGNFHNKDGTGAIAL